MRTLLNRFKTSPLDKKRQVRKLRRKLKKAIDEERLERVRELIAPPSNCRLRQANKANDQLGADLSLIEYSVTNVIDTAATSSSLKRRASSESSIDLMSKQKRLTLSKDWSQTRRRRLAHADHIDGVDNALHYASRYGKTCMIDMLLETNMFGIDEPNCSSEKNTALGLACDKGWLDTAKVLIARGADVNYVNARGKTPLILATELIEPYDYEMCRMLVENGADVNKTTDGYKNDTLSSSALLSACLYSNNRLIEYLITVGGAQVEPSSSPSCSPALTLMKTTTTPLIRCSLVNNLEMLERMLDRFGARVNTCNARGETPLWVAAYRGHLDVVKLLVERYHARVDSRDRDGDTPLAVACYAQRYQVVEYLLTKGSNANNRGLRGDSPLHIALGSITSMESSSSRECLSSGERIHRMCMALIERGGADVNAINNDIDNESVLMTACRSSVHTATVRALLDRVSTSLDEPSYDYTDNTTAIDDVSSSSSSNGGVTPFRYVIEHLKSERRLRTAIALVSAGCDVNKGFGQDYYPLAAQVVAIRTLLGQDSVFDYLFSIPKSYFDIYALSLNQDDDTDTFSYGQQPNMSINRFINLVILILKAGYRVSERDGKMFKISWLRDYLLIDNRARLVNYLDGMFASATMKPRSLKDICRIAIRKSLNKPLRNSIPTLLIPTELREFLELKC